MPNFIIRCDGDKRYTVRIEDVPVEHAQVAFESLKRDPFTPDGLYLEREDEEEPQRGLLARLLRKR